MTMKKGFAKSLSNSTKTTIRAMIDFFVWGVIQKFTNITKIPRHLGRWVVIFGGAVFVGAMLGEFLSSPAVLTPHIGNGVSEINEGWVKIRKRKKKKKGEFESLTDRSHDLLLHHDKDDRGTTFHNRGQKFGILWGNGRIQMLSRLSKRKELHFLPLPRSS